MTPTIKAQGYKKYLDLAQPAIRIRYRENIGVGCLPLNIYIGVLGRFSYTPGVIVSVCNRQASLALYETCIVLLNCALLLEQPCCGWTL